MQQKKEPLFKIIGSSSSKIKTLKETPKVGVNKEKLKRTKKLTSELSQNEK